MYPKNAATPPRIAIGAVVQISDGAVQTSGCTITVRGEGGSEATGGGTTAYGASGIVYYSPTQAETNYSAFAVIASKTGCIPVCATVVTTASSTAGKVDVSHFGGTSVTARDIGASVLLSSGTGTGQISLTSGRADANVTYFGGSAGTFASGRPEANASHWDGTAVASANVRANVLQWNSAAIATPDTAGYPKVTIKSGTGTGEVSLSSGAVLLQATQTGVTIPTVTNVTNAPTSGDFTATMKASIGTAVAASAVASVTGAVGSVTGNVGGNVVGSVGSVTGNVGGNVVGSVGSVTGAVGSVTATVNASLTQILGTAITETSAGYLSAGFKKLLDVASPVFTLASINQTGDSFARIGSTGSGLTSLAPAATALSTATWTGTRAGYIDNLSGGAVMLASSYTAPDNAGITAIKAVTDALPDAGALTSLATSAALATVDTNVDAILVDTGTTIPATLADMSGATFNTATDSLEAIRDRGDAAWTGGGGGGDATEAKQDAIIALIGTPAGVSVSADIAAVKAQTAAIETDTQDLQTQVGTDGAGLTAIPWNAAWDAEVQSECADALTAYDPPTKTELDAAFPTNFTSLVISAGGIVDANLEQIDGDPSFVPSLTSLLEEGVISGGNPVQADIVRVRSTPLNGTYVGAGFDAFFNVASPTLTVASINQTGDSFARIGAPVGASISADIASVKSDANSTLSTTAKLAGMLESDGFGGNRWTTSALNNTWSVSTRTLTGSVTVGSIATNAVTADALAADAVTEIQSGLATASSLASVATDTGTTIPAAIAALDFAVAGDIPTAVEIADSILLRSVSNTEATAGQFTLTTAILRTTGKNVRDVDGDTLTTYRTDGTTTHLQVAIDTDADADPVTEVG